MAQRATSGPEPLRDVTAFGPRLRRERERRGLTLNQVAHETKIAVPLLASLERNDFARWPDGLFGRAFLRAYAVAIHEDPQATVEEFTRLFVSGSARVQAPSVLVVPDEAAATVRGFRLTLAETDRSRWARRLATAACRLVGSSIDLAMACSVGVAASSLVAGSFWIAAAIALAGDLLLGTLALGSTVGVWLTLRHASRLRVFARSSLRSRPIPWRAARGARGILHERVIEPGRQAPLG
jgi:transcriptional regulator with XRE-family HTH domain